jgi:3-phosphoshikimate 1-carboxyvinyltransferase
VKLTAAPGTPLSGEASIPGDKSCSHRALILAAMADGETRITGLLESDDLLATSRALESFGVRISKSGDQWVVQGSAWQSPDEPIDCGNSGTTARLLMGAVAGMPGVAATFIGDQSLSTRPMKRATSPLIRMGARVEGGDCLPIWIEGARLGGIEHRNVPASAPTIARS